MKGLPLEQLQHLLRFACPICCAKAGETCKRSDNLFLCPGRPQESPAPKRPRKAKKKGQKRRDVKPGKFAGINRASRAKARKPSAGKLASKRTKPEGKFLEWLAQEKNAGRVLDYREQPGSLRMGDDLHYRPDFLAVEADGLLVLYEVKGARGWKLDPKGRVKWKAAGELWPFLEFRGALLTSDGWAFETYTPTWPWPSEGETHA